MMQQPKSREQHLKELVTAYITARNNALAAEGEIMKFLVAREKALGANQKKDRERRAKLALKEFENWSNQMQNLIGVLLDR